MWRDQSVAVIIPAFNEERLITDTLGGIPAYVDRILVIDDNSGDATRERVTDWPDPRVSLVTHPHNRGVGAAIVSGYRAALAANLDVMVVMAGDNQMNPVDLPRLLDAIADGAHYAKGNRFLHEASEQMPRLRRLGSKFLSTLTRALSGLVVDDCQCGYTALSGSFARRLPLDDLWPRYGYPNDILMMLAAWEADVTEVPIEPVYATESSGLHAGHLLHIAWLQVRRHRWHSKNRAARQRRAE